MNNTSNPSQLFVILLISIIVIGLSVVFLCIRIILKKKGEFPKTHVSSNKAMQDKGIHCIQSQDFEMRHTRDRIPEHS